jgi:hypothetical protein
MKMDLNEWARGLAVEKLAEVLARQMAATVHGNPDELFIIGEAQRVAVPGSFGYVPDMRYAKPLWTAYLGVAHKAIDEMRRPRDLPKSDTQ